MAVTMQTTGSSVANQDSAPPGTFEAGRVPLSHFAWFTLAYNVAVVIWAPTCVPPDLAQDVAAIGLFATASSCQ
jgi:hypothetical protein